MLAMMGRMVVLGMEIGMQMDLQVHTKRESNQLPIMCFFSEYALPVIQWKLYILQAL